MRATSWLCAALSDAADKRAWSAVFLACLPVYLLTAHYTLGSVDTESAVLPAWQLVHHGNLWVEHMHHRPYWSVPAGHHLVSNRTPGVELVNLPFVSLLYWLGPSMIPGALTAAMLTAATIGLLFLVFRRLVALKSAVLATGVMAFGTSLWTVAAAEMWPHTVDAFCLALTAYALSRRRWWVAGVALGIGVVARPHIAVIALVAGLGLGWSERSLRPFLGVGVPASVGLLFVELWNALLYGSASVSGGYAGYVHANLTQTSGSTIQFLATNVAGFLISPQRGLFVFLPLALVLHFSLRTGWGGAAPWVRTLAVGGVAYTLLQLKINRFDGGDAFFGTRLSTELVVCAAPLAAVCLRSWAAGRDRRGKAVGALAALSISIQAVGAFAFSIPASSASRPWRASPVWDAFTAHPMATGALLWCGIAAATLILWHEPRSAAAADGGPLHRKAVAASEHA